MKHRLELSINIFRMDFKYLLQKVITQLKIRKALLLKTKDQPINYTIYLIQFKVPYNEEFL